MPNFCVLRVIQRFAYYLFGEWFKDGVYPPPPHIYSPKIYCGGVGGLYCSPKTLPTHDYLAYIMYTVWALDFMAKLRP